MKRQIGLLILVLSLITPTLSLACRNMGPNTHVGIVKGIDLKEGTLTLIDAESGKPITFSAPSQLLSSIKPSDRVMINFKMEGEKLIAEKIHS